MRILHAVHDFLPRHRAGAEVHVAALCHALERAGHSTHVLAAEYDPARAHATLAWRHHDGLGVTEVINNWEFADLADATASPRIDRALAQALDALAPEVVHLHSLFNLSFALPRLAQERGIPCVATLHDYTAVCPSGGKRVHRAESHLCREIDPDRCARCFPQSAQARQMAAARLLPRGRAGAAAVRLARFALRRTPAMLGRVADAAAARGPAIADRARIEARLADFFERVAPLIDHFVAPSSSLAEEFRRLGLPEQKIEVAENGIEPFEPVAASRPRRPLRIGFVGSLAREKGAHRLIEAAVHLPGGGFEVHLFGDAPEPDYERSLRRAAVGLPVVFHGGFGRGEIAAVYGAIDVLAVPSQWLENAPLVIPEAQHAGVPVVGARIGGIPERIRHGEDGLLFDPFSTAELVEALAGLIAAPERVAAMAARQPLPKSIDQSALEWEARYGLAVARRPLQASRPAASARAGAPPATLAAVIVNYRTARETIQAVRSLEASRRRFDHVIVVDDGSCDGSCELLASRLGAARLVRQARNSGFPAAIDAGLDAALAAGADRVLLLNSDALLARDAIEKLLAVLDANRTVGIASPQILDAARPGRVLEAGISFSPRTGRMRVIDAGAAHQAGRAGPRVVDGVSGCAMLIAREVIERIGGLDRDYFFSFEDLDFCLRARRAGWASVCVLDALAWHHGSHSIGARSPRRLYFAARNHLLLARRAAPQPLALAVPRALSIVALNLAHALRGVAAPRAAGLRQVGRGVVHHLAGRYGAGAPVEEACGAPLGPRA